MTGQFHFRAMQANDINDVLRIAQLSPWSFCHVPFDEIPQVAATRPGVIISQSENEHAIGFLLSNACIPPIAWLGGFGVQWAFRDQSNTILEDALAFWYRQLQQCGVTSVYYSGYDAHNDWLMNPLLQRNYRIYSMLRSYDKMDTHCPTRGNQEVIIRDVDPERDIPSLLQIEASGFEVLWRHDEREFREIAANHPFFIVAEMPDVGVIGYQFSTIDEYIGFFIRIAVDAQWNNKGVGARLLWEAMQFFAAHNISTILLNTEEHNTHAHKLYEWFGFQRVAPDGFVLAYDLPDASSVDLR